MAVSVSILTSVSNTISSQRNVNAHISDETLSKTSNPNGTDAVARVGWKYDAKVVKESCVRKVDVVEECGEDYRFGCTSRL